MFNRFQALLLAYCVTAGSAFADDWKSADGNIAVTPPDQMRFDKIDSQPPLIMTWVAHDESIKLGVVEIIWSSKVKIIRESVEKAFAKEINGEIIASSVEEQFGHTIMKMTAKGVIPNSEDEIYITQFVVGVGEKVYKIMAVGVKQDARTDPDAINFLNSFKILPPASSATVDLPSARTSPNAASQKPSESPVNNWSGKIGLASIIVVILVLVLKRATKK